MTTPTPTHGRRTAPPPIELAALSTLSIAELRALWPIHMGRARMPVQRRLIIRELAWRTQERVYGGLDAKTKRLLDAAVRAAVQRRGARAHAPPPGEAPEPPMAAPRPLRRTPAPAPAAATLARVPTGSRLIRVWPEDSKLAHEVTILEGGKAFAYKGEQFKSLSEIARLITGTRWSGPRFFGLTSRTRRSEGGEP